MKKENEGGREGRREKRTKKIYICPWLMPHLRPRSRQIEWVPLLTDWIETLSFKP